MHGAREADARHQPDEAGGIAELGREDRTDQRPRAGDRGKVMAEEHEAMRRVIVASVVQLVRRRDPRIVEHHEARRDERAVVAVRDGEDAEDRKDEVQGTHLLRSVADRHGGTLRR